MSAPRSPAGLDALDERESPLHRKASHAQLALALPVSILGVVLGWAAPTMLDVLSTLVDALLFVLFLGTAGWVYLFLLLLDQLGV